ncbi:MAG: hypothetical protein ACYC97_07360 [Metallibacterium sp.]
MGKGVAAAFKQRFPAMFEDYQRRCERHWRCCVICRRSPMRALLAARYSRRSAMSSPRWGCRPGSCSARAATARFRTTSSWRCTTSPIATGSASSRWAACWRCASAPSMKKTAPSSRSTSACTRRRLPRPWICSVASRAPRRPRRS